MLVTRALASGDAESAASVLSNAVLLAIGCGAALALVLQAALERTRQDRAARAAVLARPRVAHVALRLVIGRVRRRVVRVRVLPLARRAWRTRHSTAVAKEVCETQFKLTQC